MAYFTSNERAHQLLFIDAFIFENIQLLKKRHNPVFKFEKVLFLREFQFYTKVLYLKSLTK